MSKNSLFCPKKESSITQKVLIEIFFNVIFHLMYMVWLDLDAKSALDTGTPSVEAHKCAVMKSTPKSRHNFFCIFLHFLKINYWFNYDRYLKNKVYNTSSLEPIEIILTCRNFFLIQPRFLRAI